MARFDDLHPTTSGELTITVSTLGYPRRTVLVPVYARSWKAPLRWAL